MAKVRVSEDYEVVIPPEVREGLDIAPGQEIEIVRNGDHIELMPEHPILKLRGILKGVDVRIERDEDRF